MALVKTVEMRVLADAGDAQAKLDDLDAKAKDLDGNDIKMRFRLEDGDAKAQLDAIRAKADLLGYKDVSIRVKVDGAGRAIADLAAVKHEEDEVARRGLLDRLIGGAGGGIPGSAGVPFAGGIPLPALAAAVPLVGALAVELTGVVSGFAAAGAGAGAFALLAMPAVKKVETALKDIQKGKSLASLHLTVDEKGAISGIEKLKAEFAKLSTAFQPQAFKVFNDALKVAANLLPHLAQFATPFANAIDGLLQKLAKFTASKGFSDWLKQFSRDVGPAVTSIGEGVGKVANAFGKLMTVMSGKDVGHAISIAFSGVAGTINVVTFAIRRFMQNWDGMSSAAAKAGHAVAGAFKSIGQGAVSFQNTVDHAFTTVIHGAENMVSGVIHAVSGLAGKIKGVFAGAAGWLLNAGKAIIQGLINGIESMLGPLEAIASKVAGVVSKIAGWLGIHSPSTVFFGYGVNIAEGLARGMESGLPRVGGASGRLAGAAVSGPAAAATGAHGYGGGAHYEIHLHGVIDKQGAAREIHQLMLEYKRNGGRAALGLA